MTLPDKCISMDSHAMGVVIPHDESITSGVQNNYSKPRDKTFISFSSSFSKNLSENITNKQDIYQKNISHSFFSSMKPSIADSACSLLLLKNPSMANKRSIESSLMLGGTAFPQVLFTSLPKRDKEVNMKLTFK